jgi:hypothetical protein
MDLIQRYPSLKLLFKDNNDVNKRMIIGKTIIYSINEIDSTIDQYNGKFFDIGTHSYRTNMVAIFLSYIPSTNNFIFRLGLSGLSAMYVGDVYEKNLPYTDITIIPIYKTKKSYFCCTNNKKISFKGIGIHKMQYTLDDLIKILSEDLIDTN